jgi:hypothetical protein
MSLAPDDRSDFAGVAAGAGAGSAWPLAARATRFLTGLTGVDFASDGMALS